MKSRRPTERLDDPLIQLQLPGINDVAQVEEEKPPVLAQLPSQPPLLTRVTSTQVEQEDGGGQVLDFYSDGESTFDLAESTVTRQPCQRPPMFENVRECGDGNLFAYFPMVPIQATGSFCKGRSCSIDLVGYAWTRCLAPKGQNYADFALWVFALSDELKLGAVFFSPTSFFLTFSVPAS